MLLTAEFWVAAAFVIFMAIVWKVGGFGMMTKGLDGRAKRVRHELDEARRLREEAAAVLADYKRRRTEAEREAEAIVAGARQEAERIAEEGHRRLDEFIARRTKTAETKIAQAEVQAAAQVRAAAADAAVRASEAILRERMQGDAAQDLVRLSLGDVRTRLSR
ncbi:MAG: ATP F0F1 synthase subunit B [Methylobacterium sp. CG08_land_8_20_14_0_20_71_15]|uniref:ATP synthase subunit b n=1 Tax=Methylobacterium jeotgali TaxID=381630 RepID=A0ABQ4T1R7_9HYPH|nr:MAG: ATP F0F1 synthase subunit B [Methylobacterium sp. CG09_land_8_20_14_0_10_71_15]PIU15404.1 MAG: ATP F0F1 synthase subunit B [Methylobacterium sp. CG08_land_8_20_14_0_20_71_15]GBU16226.1 ATP synthase subunit b 1 [Methylobacterium sp.]GJE08749.1 ATP synthase subunit b [Methylobacterium jeotgali]